MRFKGKPLKYNNLMILMCILYEDPCLLRPADINYAVLIK